MQTLYLSFEATEELDQLVARLKVAKAQLLRDAVDALLKKHRRRKSSKRPQSARQR
jgi:hypothetical protein